jgi:serine/threonine protein kinase/Tol biopolymer transport system component
MGEVYRATDTKLRRDVAIKVLPEAFFEDEEKRLRFEREARTLASLNHPGIAAIYSFEEVPGSSPSSSRHLLVMELVEGDGLDAKIASGALPLEESLSFAKQIAEALETAHEKGIVHRDLKPANVKVTADGRVKLLDFGLAKAFEGDTDASKGGSGGGLTRSPTLTARATAAGVILGTAAYMSPEQARGKAVDKRADVWAFGCVLYEMLTGRRAFDGETVSDMLAAVLTKEPDWSALPEKTPTGVKRVLRRCLQRDAKLRLRDIGDARLDLEEIGAATASGFSPFEEKTALVSPTVGRSDGAKRESGSRKSLSLSWAVAVAAILLAAAFAALYFDSTRQRDTGAGSVTRLQFVPRRGERLNFNLRAFAISPDGTRLTYVVSKGATTELRLRALDSAESAVIPGTEGAQHPFFSPDGKWIAFNGGVKLKKVAVSGGSPVTLGEAWNFRGGVWAEDGRIYFVPNQYVPIARIPAAGGSPENVTRIRAADGEQQHRWPELLPGGRILLYVIGSGGEWDDATIVAERLGTGERKVLVKGGTYPRYLPTGQLVYARAGALYAVAFDDRSLEVKGSPVEVARDVYVDSKGFAAMDLSRTGMLVTAPSDSIVGDLMLSWVDRAGRSEPLNLPRQPYGNMAISPDGTRVALSIGNAIGVLDAGRLALAKLTLGARAENPVWSGDGRRLYFGLEKGQHYQVFWKAADDSGSEQLAFASDSSEDPYQMSVDGTRLLTVRTPPDGQNELLLREVGLGAAGGAPKLLVKSPYLDASATLAPGGRFAAYEAQESGRPEIYVHPTSGEDRKWQVSSEGGTYPVWSPDGKEIFYLCGMKLMAVAVEPQGKDLRVGTPKVLFENHEIYWYDVSRDAKRFFVAENPNPGTSSHLDVVVNWFSEVKRKVQEARVP